MPVIALECYDRYLGFLTMTDPLYRDLSFQKKNNIPDTESGDIIIQKSGGKMVKGKQVKKWQPKIIRRGS